jgi:hypothetical protein
MVLVYMSVTIRRLVIYCKCLNLIEVQWDITPAIYRLQESLGLSEVCIGRHLSNMFPVQNGIRQGDTFSPLCFNFCLE